MTTFTREDFEMAARAVGLRVRTWDGHTGTMCAIDDGQHGRMWMPPHDDGEALRLAVALETFNLMHVLSMHGDPELYKADRAKAIRYAIFREAIRLGRAMPAPDVRPTYATAPSPPGETDPDQQLETLKTNQPTTDAP